jgi:hypothetical protein
MKDNADCDNLREEKVRSLPSRSNSLWVGLMELTMYVMPSSVVKEPRPGLDQGPVDGEVLV